MGSISSNFWSRLNHWIRLGQHHFSWQEDLALLNSLRQRRIVNGDAGVELEELFSSRQGARFSVAVNSGTSALVLALMALDVGPGDEVIVPSFSWVSTANAPALLGAKVVFCDLAESGFLLDIGDVAAKVTNKTKVVIPVHQFGELVEVQNLRKVLDGSKVKILEDAACAVGSSFHGKKAGAHGDVAIYSLHPRKVITAGEGGIVSTNNYELFSRVRSLRNHGLQDMTTPELGPRRGLSAFSAHGHNMRMPEFSAAVGVQQLKKLDRFLIKRQTLASKYISSLRSLEWLEVPSLENGSTPNWQSFVIRLKGKAVRMQDKLIAHMAENSVEVAPASVCIHKTEAFRGHSSLSLPRSEAAFREAVALPLHTKMRASHVRRVVQALEEFGASVVGTG